MGLVVNTLQKFALSKTGQKIYKYAYENSSKLNQRLPLIESLTAVSFYTIATQSQKNLKDDQKKLLHLQNIGSGLAGITVSAWVSKKVSKYIEKIIPSLDPKLIPDIHKVQGGLRVFLPICTCILFTRCIFPALIAVGSSIVADKHKKAKGLNVKV